MRNSQKHETDYGLLKERLLQFEASFNYEDHIKNDPVFFVRSFSNPCDIEIAGLISAVFAYGNVNLIIKNLFNIFDRIDSPMDYIKAENIDKYAKLDGLYYRFNNDEDIKTLLWSIGKVLDKWGSIRNLFLEGYESGSIDKENEKLEKGIEKLSNTFLEIGSQSPFVNRRNYQYFFPIPSKSSSCKRLCLFLRWMNRKDRVDLGCWRGVEKKHLIIPVDIHISKISRLLGLTTIKNPSWKMALEITRSLRLLDGEDPLRFDFPLCHMGISRQCDEKYNRHKCEECMMSDFCLVEKKNCQK